MTRNTLTVRVEPEEEFHEDVLEDIRALERGDEMEDTHVLSLPDEEALHRLFSPRNLELLRVIGGEGPASMREAARLVDRDIKEVSRNLNDLADMGVIEFVQEGRSKRPVVQYDNIEVTVPLRAESEARESEAGA